METFTSEQISPNIWKTVENDPFKQYPFLYSIIGVDKCILVDTGSGSADYFRFLETNINRNKLPYLVVCTHVHFDHVGGNFQFSQGNCLGIYMGGQNKTFTQNFEINSLAMAHSGAQVKHFAVTNWLNEGDLIYLDDKNQTKQNSLEVLFTPGHTPDSIALYAHWDKRLFVGDTIYPYTAIHLDCLGSNVEDFKVSLKKMINFVSNVSKNDLVGESLPPTSSTEPPLTSQQKKAMADFCATLGLSQNSLDFSLESLMTLSDWSCEDAINFYLSSMDNIVTMCPPQPKKAIVSTSSDIRLSCGHVEYNLGVNTLQQLLDMIEFVQLGALPPAYRDGEYGEYSTENFTVMLPMKHVK